MSSKIGYQAPTLMIVGCGFDAEKTRLTKPAHPRLAVRGGLRSSSPWPQITYCVLYLACGTCRYHVPDCNNLPHCAFGWPSGRLESSPLVRAVTRQDGSKELSTYCVVQWHCCLASVPWFVGRYQSGGSTSFNAMYRVDRDAADFGRFERVACPDVAAWQRSAAANSGDSGAFISLLLSSASSDARAHALVLKTCWSALDGCRNPKGER